MRAPSYKAIAMAILKNDLQLKTLGFSGMHTDWYFMLKNEKAEKNNKQERLF
jgi:predicted phosphoadenosine phosphosulfate sulfurtransferase